jgi:hypothetical protein
MEQHIISDPNVMMGKPVVAGTRITVELILESFQQEKQLSRLSNLIRTSQKKAYKQRSILLRKH